jgi:predicted nuclease of predicted toxin-antitoxin system
MRILLDGNLPRAFGALLPGHRVETVHQRRWSDLDDAPLLSAAEQAGFEAFLTMDQSLRFQQNLRGLTLRIVVLRAPTNKLADLVPLATPVLALLPTMAPGEVRLVGA